MLSREPEEQSNIHNSTQPGLPVSCSPCWGSSVLSCCGCYSSLK